MTTYLGEGCALIWPDWYCKVASNLFSILARLAVTSSYSSLKVRVVLVEYSQSKLRNFMTKIPMLKKKKGSDRCIIYQNNRLVTIYKLMRNCLTLLHYVYDILRSTDMPKWVPWLTYVGHKYKSDTRGYVSDTPPGISYFLYFFFAYWTRLKNG